MSGSWVHVEDTGRLGLERSGGVLTIGRNEVRWDIVVLDDGSLDIHRTGTGFSYGLTVRPEANNRVILRAL